MSRGFKFASDRNPDAHDGIGSRVASIDGHAIELTDLLDEHLVEGDGFRWNALHGRQAEVAREARYVRQKWDNAAITKCGNATPT
jgi:hypothetical protein